MISWINVIFNGRWIKLGNLILACLTARAMYGVHSGRSLARFVYAV